MSCKLGCNCCCHDESACKQQKRSKTADDERTRATQLRESLVARLTEVAPNDEWHDSDSIESLRALLRKKLGRKTFEGERKFSQTFYRTFELTPRGDVTVAARYDFTRKCWDAGFAWRNPLDNPAPNLAKKIARNKLGMRELLWFHSPYGQPPWWEIIRDEFLTRLIDYECVDGHGGPPSWLGDEITRLESLIEVWYELYADAE